MLPSEPSSSLTSDYEDDIAKEQTKAEFLAMAPTTLDPQVSLALESAREMATRLVLGDQDSKPESLPPPPPLPQAHGATITPRNPSSRSLHHEDEAEKTELERQSNIGVGGSRPGAFEYRPPQENDLSSGDTPAPPSEQEDEDSQTETLDPSTEAAASGAASGSLAPQEQSLEEAPIADSEPPSCVVSAHVVDEDKDIETRLRAQFQEEAAEIANQTRTSVLKEAVEAQKVSPMKDGDKRKRKYMIYCALILLVVMGLAVGLGIGLSGGSLRDNDDTPPPEVLEFEQDVYITYTISVFNGSLEEIPRRLFVPDLIASLDMLAPVLLSELLSPEETRRLRARLLYTPVTMLFPTFVEGGAVIRKFVARCAVLEESRRRTHILFRNSLSSCFFHFTSLLKFHE